VRHLLAKKGSTHTFWSTMYALPQLLVANPIDRYLIQLAEEVRFAT
jgi:hypothetical protein